MTQPQVVELWPLRLHREMLGAVAADFTLPLHRVKDTPGAERRTTAPPRPRR
jgi:hypothetical protein